MSSIVENPSTLSSNHVKTPEYVDGEPITWLGNPALLEGALFEVGEYFTRNHTFQPLFEHRAALLPSGKVALTSAASIPFINKTISGVVHTFANPCPDAPDRVQAYNDSIGQPGGPPANAPVHSSPNLTQTILSSFVVSPYAVDAELGKLHSALACIIKDAHVANRLTAQSAGNGLDLLRFMRQYATTADNTDRALVMSQYEASASATLHELTENSLRAWIKAYMRAKRHVPVGSRKSDAAEVELVNILVYRDPGIRELYEITTSAKRPTTLDEAVDAVSSLLRRRGVIEQIDNVRGIDSGTSGGVSLAEHRALQAEHQLAKQALVSAVKKLSFKPDATKNKKFKSPVGGDQVKAPRDKDGRVTMWVKGMGRCRFCDGEHLNRDCSSHPLQSSSASNSSRFKTAHSAAAAETRCDDCDDDMGSVAALVAQIDAIYNNGSDAHPARHEGNVATHTALADNAPTSIRVGSKRRNSDVEITYDYDSQATQDMSEANKNCHMFGTAIDAIAPNFFTTPPDSLEPEMRYFADPEATLIRLASIADRVQSLPGNPKSFTCTQIKTKEMAKHLLMIGVHRMPSSVGFSTSREMGLCPFAFNRLLASTHNPPEEAWQLGIGLLVVCYESWLKRAEQERLTSALNDSPNPRKHAALAVSHGSPCENGSSVIEQLAINRGGKHVDFQRLVFSARVDSGCTAHATQYRSVLTNIRACDEEFDDANGATVKCIEMGDMSVWAMRGEGKAVQLHITNVRHVPSFTHTLLSVGQLWDEMRIDVVFRDIKSLVLADGTLIPYEKKVDHNSVTLCSDSRQANASIVIPSQQALAVHGTGSLGYHDIKSTNHITKLSNQRLGELMHRRLHVSVNKIRAAAFNTKDGMRNLASSLIFPCSHCASAHIKRSKHSSALHPPSPEPGTLHVDLKELVTSIGGYRYAAFFIEESTRYVFLRALKLKSEIGNATRSVIAEFDAIVGVTLGSDGHPLPRPRVTKIHSDHEGGLESTAFVEFAGRSGRHQTFSPPHDHDLNPIAERVIGVISEHAAAVRDHCKAPPGFWPHLIRNSVNIHNAIEGEVGSAPADRKLSPVQRLTHKPPKLMDLATFGCAAIVLKSPVKQDKTRLSTRGAKGIFLGRSRDSIGTYDVLVGNLTIVSSSSVMVNEEEFPWHGENRHEPLSAHLPHAPAALLNHVPTSTTPNNSMARHATAASINSFQPRQLRALLLFSGPYSTAGNLADSLTSRTWSVRQLDNDDKAGGGWKHDLLNDETYSTLLIAARDGAFDAMMVAFPCSTFSASRFFDARDGTSGPPPIRNKTHPDGLPADELPPKHQNELKKSNLLLTRTVEVIAAARLSPAKTSIIFENPAARSIKSMNTFIPELEHLHSTIFDTSEYKRLESIIGALSTATFAYCRLSTAMQQKYTTLAFTPDTANVLSELNKPEFQCNHPKGSHNPVGGIRDGDNNKFTSAKAAAYPQALNEKIAEAFTLARTGDTNKSTTDHNLTLDPHETEILTSSMRSMGDTTTTSQSGVSDPRTDGSTLATGGEQAPDETANEYPVSNRQFNDAEQYEDFRPEEPTEPQPQGKGDRPRRIDAQPDINYNESRSYMRRQQRALAAEGTVHMERTVAELVVEALEHVREKRRRACECEKLTHTFEFGDGDWLTVQIIHPSAKRAQDGRWYAPATNAVSRHIASNTRASRSPKKSRRSQARRTQQALRADSIGAPETHKQVLAHPDKGWLKAEQTELGNHAHNGSWVPMLLKDVPKGRKVHKLVWVYKQKRDGTLKARLCVQGCTMQSGIDYDQVFSPTIRYSSVRGLFAFAAQRNCGVRSIDLTAAYLQGDFEEGEVVFAHMPPGYEETDDDGDQMCVRVVKPVYGIPQSGRRLHRKLRAWMVSKRFTILDDSDSCVYVLKCSDGEILIVGIYTDNLQIVHSASIDKAGNAAPGTQLAEFIKSLTTDWDVVDEGPMGDMLGIEIERRGDGSFLLNQPAYIAKLIKRFMPDGVPPHVQRNSTPYSKDFLIHINEALSADEIRYPEITKPFQERVGSLMYSCSAVRPDIAYPVHQLCRCMHKPTPALMLEVDHVFAYLHRTANVGLTFDAGDTGELHGYADASWETNKSVSGYLIRHGTTLISFGSSTQKTTALSSCESEIVALSAGTTELVFQRKWWMGVTSAASMKPSDIFSDSKSARDVSYNPEHFGRMKHVARRHFFVRDMVEELEINVPYVKSDDNLADFLTKPLAPKRFHYLRSIIMNEKH